MLKAVLHHSILSVCGAVTGNAPATRQPRLFIGSPSDTATALFYLTGFKISNRNGTGACMCTDDAAELDAVQI